MIDVKRQRRFDQGLWFWIGSPSLNTWGKGAIGYAVKTYHYILDTIKNGSRESGAKRMTELYCDPRKGKRYKVAFGYYFPAEYGLLNNWSYLECLRMVF